MLGLSPAQVAGSALAAVSGALLASFAGTTGTIIGTAVGSVVATVGGTLYTWSLKRSSAAVRRTAAQVRQTALLTGALPRTVAQGPMRSEDDREVTSEVTPGGTPQKNGQKKAEAGAAAAAEQERERRSVPWGKTLVASLAVTVVALAGITTFEAVTGQPISSLLGRDDSQGTSVGNLVRSDDQSSKDPVRKDKGTPADEESQAPDPTPKPADVPEVPVPSITPTPDPTQPSGEPSVAPEDGAEGAPAADPGDDADAVTNPAP